VEASGTWLCPTAFDRARLLEMEAKLSRPRAIMYGSLAIVFVIATHWVGWWILRTGIQDARPGGLPVTASFGVAAARGAEVEFEPLFREADAALYLAKRSGRNQAIGRDHQSGAMPGAGMVAAALGLPGPGA
jgi:GGDEF domain-containing protein